MQKVVETKSTAQTPKNRGKKKVPPAEVKGKTVKSTNAGAESPEEKQVQPRYAAHFDMDGTSHVEMSVMANEEFSGEIIKETEKVFNPKRLEKAKKKSVDAYLKEGERQVIGLWKGIERLGAHAALFTVLFLVHIGEILFKVETFLASKPKYMAWLGTFGPEHTRWFQHARELFLMGDFVLKHASLGKNRLLGFKRLAKIQKTDVEDLLQEFPFRDTTRDDEGRLFVHHVDSVTTMLRLRNVGIGYASFRQASLITWMSRGALEVNAAEHLFIWLQAQPDGPQALSDYILNGLSVTDSVPGVKRDSFDRVLAKIVHFCEDAVPENINEFQIDVAIFEKAYQLMGALKERLREAGHLSTEREVQL